MISSATTSATRVPALRTIGSASPTKFLALLIVVLTATAAQSQQVTYKLVTDPDAGAWELFAEATINDNAGLALVAVELLNVDSPVDLMLPMSQFDLGGNLLDVAGFLESRVDDASSYPIGASQDIQDMSSVVFGLGQTSGSLTGTGGNTFVQENYGAPLLVAAGTYDPLAPAAPTFGQAVADVFVSSSGTTTVGAQVSTIIVPEPISLVIVLISLPLLALRRQAR